ncbi:alpha/beta hydrolase [Streptomyces halobius]|uniref:Alpha/beta hydrolase n=1 Tax=Streptomyces halobius TaxID=2879846 RepID=A0ABY4M9W9_9ACTN|nr:alpha/beta hydrolase [Streptomyces halobius]UQA94500.1 alpha/beta hydrolase [Streptomyces halobius]
MSASDEESALLGLAPVAPDRTVAYGPHPDQIVDLYEPTGAGPGSGARPLAVLLHGGFWRAAYDRRHLSPCAAELARHGLPVALAEYRRVGAGGGAPRTFEDVTAAIEAARAEFHVKQFHVKHRPVTAPAAGDERAAPGGLVLVGHSAGGHLALLAAARPGTPVTRVLAVSPVADLARAHELELSEGAVAELVDARGGDAVDAGDGDAGDDGEGDAVGTGEADAPALAARIAAADPMCHPLPADLPVTLLHGTDDADVPLEISRRYAAAHPSATTLFELRGVGHYATVTPGTPAFRTLLAALLDE